MNIDSTIIKLQNRLEIALLSNLEHLNAITITKILICCNISITIISIENWTMII